LAAALLLGGCGTGPDEGLLDGSCSVTYEPPLVASATENCDRLVSHALLAVNTRGDFDLSINVVEDCSRVGSGFTFSEVLKLGTYTRRGNTLSFTPDGESAPAFTGELEGAYIRLTLPPAVGALSYVDVQILLGPRAPL
jgi:hypothetical protein